MDSSDISTERVPEASGAPLVSGGLEFNSWFDGSRLVDQIGQPLRLFHGTGADFDEFDEGGVYLSVDPDVASNTAIEVAYSRGQPPRVLVVYASIQNPAILEDAEIEGLGYDHPAIEKLKLAGHDGAMNKSKSEVFAFSGRQVRSIFSFLRESPRPGESDSSAQTAALASHERVAALPQTDSPAFKEWFGESRVVDKSGAPLVVFHGTFSAFDAFDHTDSKAIEGHPSSNLGIFFSDAPHVANTFASSGDDHTVANHKDEGAQVIPAYLAIRNPMVMTWGQFRRDFIDAAERDDWATIDRAIEFRQDLIAAGYDGIRIRRSKSSPMVESEGDQWVAFEPSQVKSAIGNRGTFDRSVDDIAYRRSQPSALAKRPPQSNSTGLPTLQEIQQLIDLIPIQLGAMNWPKVRVISGLDEAPAALITDNEKHMAQGATGNPKAWLTGDVVFVNAAAASGPEDIVTSVMHEVVGHRGLRGAFGTALNPALDQLATTNEAMVRARARQEGLNFSVLEQRRQATEEVIAYLAENMPTLPPMRRFVATVRSLLRVVIPGMGPRTDDEIVRDFVLPARRWVLSGPRATQPSPKGAAAFRRQDLYESLGFRRWFGKSKVRHSDGGPLVVYHGTSADFAAYRESETGELPHFGTALQANARIGTSSNAIREIVKEGGPSARHEGRRVMPALLTICNPLQLPDMDDWSSPGEWRKREALLPPHLRDDLLDLAKLNGRSTFFRAVKGLLLSKGYDGIVYGNAFEGKAGLSGRSWMPLHLDQIRSAFDGVDQFSSAPSRLAFDRPVQGTYTVSVDGQEVARANLSDDGRYLVSVLVRDAFRRQGIATRLYEHIEADIGHRLLPSPTHRTPDGKAFWDWRASHDQNTGERIRPQLAAPGDQPMQF